MSENPTSPLLGGKDSETDSRPQAQSSQEANGSSYAKPPLTHKYSDESTPLLSRDPDREHYDDDDDDTAITDPTSIPSLYGDRSTKQPSRWKVPTIVGVCTMCILVIVILAFGFAMPAIVKEYAEEAAVFEPTDLSIQSITSTGVKARVKGDFVLDASRVHKKPVRDLGRFGTWIAAAVEATPSNVHVYLPERDNILLGTAEIPPVVVSIRNGQVNQLDFVADIEPGDFDGIRQIAKDWIDGRIGQLRLKGEGDVSLKSGIFPFGTQTISKDVTFKGHDVPTMPQYKITKFKIHEVEFPDGDSGIAVDASATLFNDYPLTFTVPPLAFNILVPGCVEQPLVSIANATTEEFQVYAKQDVEVNVQGVIKNLPDTLIELCPDSMQSPLDHLLRQYMNGQRTTFFVRGAQKPTDGTPEWLADILGNINVPLSITGHSFRNLIRNFSMSDVHFSLPNPLADPDSPESRPQISASVRVVANLPEEMNFPVKVPRIRSGADVFFQGKKLGELDLHKWQNATSKQIEAHGDKPPGIIIQTHIKDAPLNITDTDVFQKVISAMLFGKEPIILGVEALVDIETSTALGTLIVRDIPAKGKVPLKPLSGHGLQTLTPKIGSLSLIDTTSSSILLRVLANITNPTNYSASVPSFGIQILVNETLLGYASTENIEVIPGPNHNIPVLAHWDPLHSSGKNGTEVARELISQYISGLNTTLTLRTHNGSIPALPHLGTALSNFSVEIPTPKLTPPKNPNHPDRDPDDDGPRFIDDATMHLFSSTATFTLLSPLPHETLYITHINATALYNHTEPVGTILYDLPFAVPPGASTSPKLPVDWSIGGVGYDAVKEALGGTLKLDARARAGVKVGNWEEEVWFIGHGIGAHIRI